MTIHQNHVFCLCQSRVFIISTNSLLRNVNNNKGICFLSNDAVNSLSFWNFLENGCQNDKIALNAKPVANANE